LEEGGGRITAQKWGNSSAIPGIMVSNARLLHKLYKRAPPESHRQVLMLRNWDPIKDAGAYFYQGDTSIFLLVTTELS